VSISDIRLGILGCGGRARFLLERLGALGVRPYAYADVAPAAAAAALDRFGGAYATEDAAAVLRDDAIDAVLIATRHDSHAPLALAAVAAAKHLLIEKPLALRLDECAAVTEAVERAGVTCLLGHKLRYAPLLQRLRTEIPAPVLSTVHVCDNRWADGAWTVDPVQGGGNVFSQGCHGADLALYLHRTPAVRVVAAGGALTHPGAPVPDALACAVTFADGSVSSLVMADAGEPALSKFFVQAFDGRRAGVLRQRCRALDLDGATVEADPSVADPEGDTQLLEEFLTCAATGRPASIGAGARDGWRVLRLLHAAWDCARTGSGRAVQD